ncbi:hypothetical protein HYX00_06735 [Candidatus Woesearchaeota archaeon]|nr:hypothetical protein [Candidatus Woesearchaeota archaeon]
MSKKNILAFYVFLAIAALFFAVAVSAQESRDIYVLTLNYKTQTDSLSLIEIKKSNGVAPNYDTGDASAYRLDIVSSDDKALKSIKFSPTTKERFFIGPSNKNEDNVNFVISVPYYSNARVINIYDKNNKKVLEIPLKATALEKSSAQQAVQQVTQKKSSEQDKATVYIETKSPNISWVYIFPLIAILVFLMVLISLASVEIKRRKYRN